MSQYHKSLLHDPHFYLYLFVELCRYSLPHTHYSVRTMKVRPCMVGSLRNPQSRAQASHTTCIQCVLHTRIHTFTLQKTYEVCSRFIPILQMRKLRIRKEKWIEREAWKDQRIRGELGKITQHAQIALCSLCLPVPTHWSPMRYGENLSWLPRHPRNWGTE